MRNRPDRFHRWLGHSQYNAAANAKLVERLSCSLRTTKKPPLLVSFHTLQSLLNSPSSSLSKREGFPALHGFVVVVIPVELQHHMVSTENTAENTHFSRSSRRGFGTLGLRITAWRWLRVISHSRLTLCVLLSPRHCLAIASPLPRYRLAIVLTSGIVRQAHRRRRSAAPRAQQELSP